jgi:hypothetical protein
MALQEHGKPHPNANKKAGQNENRHLPAAVACRDKRDESIDLNNNAH